MKSENLELIMKGLLSRYMNRVPDVQKILDAMMREGLISDASEITNDHIAFRTMGTDNLGIKSLEKIFLYYGYTKKDYYFFPEKKLNAHWYSPPEVNLPRVFISELQVKDLSTVSQDVIHKYTDQVDSDPVDQLDLENVEQVDRYLHSSLWDTPSIEDYETLSKESEYAAWVIYNQYYLNHFTISVHNLRPPLNTIPLFNEFLERNGFVLNDAGGKYKVSPDGLLIQSSTVAQIVEAKFRDEKRKMISGSYVEFAERKILPEYSHLHPPEIKNEHRREGFEAGNADKIFESTYVEQTRKCL